MKKILLLLFLLPLLGKAQIYGPDTKFGTEHNRSNNLFNLGIPRDTFSVPVAKQGYPHIAAKGTSLYLFDTTLKKWNLYSSGSGGPGGGIGAVYNGWGLNKDDDSTLSADSSKLSTLYQHDKTRDSLITLILARLKISDTASMLANYIRVSRFNDSLNTHWNAIMARVKYTDTTGMLSPLWTAIGGRQVQLNGTGFVKAVGTTISYDNSTYLATGLAFLLSDTASKTWDWNDITGEPTFLTSFTETDPLAFLKSDTAAKKWDWADITGEPSFAPESGSANYIQNQYATAQTADFFLRGDMKLKSASGDSMYYKDRVLYVNRTDYLSGVDAISVNGGIYSAGPRGIYHTDGGGYYWEMTSAGVEGLLISQQGVDILKASGNAAQGFKFLRKALFQDTASTAITVALADSSNIFATTGHVKNMFANIGDLASFFTTNTANGVTTFTKVNQSNYTLYGTGAFNTPIFLSNIDSNWISDLHSREYYDDRYMHDTVSITGDTTYRRLLWKRGEKNWLIPSIRLQLNGVTITPTIAVDSTTYSWDILATAGSTDIAIGDTILGGTVASGDILYIDANKKLARSDNLKFLSNQLRGNVGTGASNPFYSFGGGYEDHGFGLLENNKTYISMLGAFRMGFIGNTTTVDSAHKFGWTGVDGGVMTTAPNVWLKQSASGKLKILDTLLNLGALEVGNLAYNATTWNGNNTVPTRDDIRDKIEAMSYTFSNGLTEAAGAVKLGGSLTAATTINASTNDLILSNLLSLDIQSFSGSNKKTAFYLTNTSIDFLAQSTGGDASFSSQFRLYRDSIVYQIKNGAIFYDTIQSAVSPNRLIGWNSSSGSWGNIILGTNLSFTGNTLNATGGGGGVSDFIFTDGGGFDGTVSTSTTTPTLSLLTTVANKKILYSSSGTLTASSATQETNTFLVTGTATGDMAFTVNAITGQTADIAQLNVNSVNIFGFNPDGNFKMKELGAAAPTPPTGMGSIYFKSDGLAYGKDDAGVETQLSNGGGSGDMVLASTQTNSGAKTFLDGTLLMRNVANTFNGTFTNTNTANRIYTLPDRALTIDNITTATTSNGTGFIKANGSVISFDNSTYQQLDADLTTIAGLTATTDNFMQAKAGAWASRTPTQVTADLNVFGASLKGLVPAAGASPSSTKYLSEDGTFTTPAGGSGITFQQAFAINAMKL